MKIPNHSVLTGALESMGVGAEDHAPVVAVAAARQIAYELPIPASPVNSPAEAFEVHRPVVEAKLAEVNEVMPINDFDGAVDAVRAHWGARVRAVHQPETLQGLVDARVMAAAAAPAPVETLDAVAATVGAIMDRPAVESYLYAPHELLDLGLDQAALESIAGNDVAQLHAHYDAVLLTQGLAMADIYAGLEDASNIDADAPGAEAPAEAAPAASADGTAEKTLVQKIIAAGRRMLDWILAKLRQLRDWVLRRKDKQAALVELAEKMPVGESVEAVVGHLDKIIAVAEEVPDDVAASIRRPIPLEGIKSGRANAQDALIVESFRKLQGEEKRKAMALPDAEAHKLAKLEPAEMKAVLALPAPVIRKALRVPADVLPDVIILPAPEREKLLALPAPKIKELLALPAPERKKAILQLGHDGVIYTGHEKDPEPDTSAEDAAKAAAEKQRAAIAELRDTLAALKASEERTPGAVVRMIRDHSHLDRKLRLFMEWLPKQAEGISSIIQEAARTEMREEEMRKQYIGSEPEWAQGLEGGYFKGRSVNLYNQIAALDKTASNVGLQDTVGLWIWSVRNEAYVKTLDSWNDHIKKAADIRRANDESDMNSTLTGFRDLPGSRRFVRDGIIGDMQGCLTEAAKFAALVGHSAHGLDGHMDRVRQLIKCLGRVVGKGQDAVELLKKAGVGHQPAVNLVRMIDELA